MCRPGRMANEGWPGRGFVDEQTGPEALQTSMLNHRMPAMSHAQARLQRAIPERLRPQHKSMAWWISRHSLTAAA